MAGWSSAVFGVIADLLAVKVELDLDPPVGHWTGAGGEVFSRSGHPDITAGSRAREPLPDPAVPPRSSSEPQQLAPASPPATSGPRPPDAPSSRLNGVLPTRAAPASRWLARGRRRR